MPLLVIVSGAPGSGKSTLAARLATELCLPLLMKDELKETLYDQLGGAPDAARSALLGDAAYALLYRVVGRLLDAGTGAVLESNFYRGWAEPALGPLVARATAVQVHCGGDPATIVRRFSERAERGPRHAGHADIAALPRLREYLATGRCEPLDLGVPTLRVDTTAACDAIAYAPPFEEIVAFISLHA